MGLSAIIEEALAILAPLAETTPALQLGRGQVKALVCDLLIEHGIPHRHDRTLNALIRDIIAAALPYRIDLFMAKSPGEVEEFLQANLARGMWHAFTPTCSYRFSDEEVACLFRLNFG